MVKIRKNDNKDQNMTIKIYIYILAAILWKEPFAGAFGQKRERSPTDFFRGCQNSLRVKGFNQH